MVGMAVLGVAALLLVVLVLSCCICKCRRRRLAANIASEQQRARERPSGNGTADPAHKHKTYAELLAKGLAPILASSALRGKTAQ